MINSALGKALIVDDEKTNRLILKSLLGKQGYQTIEAVNGQEAVDLFHQEHPSIIFMDVMMPVLDGFEVLRRLKADPALVDVPVIMLTAKGQERDVLTGLSTGATDYIVKPFSLKELSARIEAALRKH